TEDAGCFLQFRVFPRGQVPKHRVNRLHIERLFHEEILFQGGDCLSRDSLTVILWALQCLDGEQEPITVLLTTIPSDWEIGFQEAAGNGVGVARKRSYRAL